MNVNIQSIHFDADSRLLGFIETKCAKLTQFFEGLVDLQVYLRLEKNKSIGNKVVEIKALVPGTTLVATEQSPSFEEATDKAIDGLRRQLLRYKARQQTVA
jgi:putative sigma-54 modulation protein